ncbi:MAG: alpha/beta hydrolase [Crocinitomicaceae bacterium]
MNLFRYFEQRFNSHKMKTFKKIKSGDHLELILYKSDVKTPKAVVFIIHGMGEHAKRYAHVSEYFKNINIAVVAIDLRGHGNSQGKRGHMPSYEDIMNDLLLAVKEVSDFYSDLPIIMYGHSIGGNLTLNYLLRHPEHIAGAIVTSPYLRLGFEPPRWKVLLAKFSTNIYPALSQPTGLDQSALSRIPQVIAEYQNDKLVHDKITASFFINSHHAGISAIENAAKITTPLLLMHGSLDRLTSPEGSKDFYAKAKSNVTFHLWEGLYHEIHNEPEKLEVFKKEVEWIEGIL